MTDVRSVIGSIDIDRLLDPPAFINQDAARIVDEAAMLGIKVTRVEINPPANLVNSMARGWRNTTARSILRGGRLEAGATPG